MKYSLVMSQVRAFCCRGGDYLAACKTLSAILTATCHIHDQSRRPP